MAAEPTLRIVFPRAFYDYPAEHWIHLRPTPDRVDPRHRPAPPARHQGPWLPSCRHRHGYKLIESAQARWRAVNAPHLVALVGAGATFKNGRLIERAHERDEQGAAA